MSDIETKPESLHLFTGYGVELEYMIVDRTTLDVRSLADRILAEIGGRACREVVCDPLAWSNELVTHVIEFKTHGPVANLVNAAVPFSRDVARVQELLAPEGACLLGSAVHPWMQPDAEATLWPHDDGPIYRALDHAFGCRGHGWLNLQSAHLNLPFYDDAEFADLHAAIRLVLPLIPALAAASPFLDGADTELWDARLDAYANHCRRLPAAMGDIIPEPVTSEAQYQETILAPLYRHLRPLDPEGLLEYEWSNARGAIARFDRNTIEIRLIDMQEHPGMDLAVLRAVAEAVRVLTVRATEDRASMNALTCAQLKAILLRTIQGGEHTIITDRDYLQLLCGSPLPLSGQQIWQRLLDRCPGFDGPERAQVERILEHGTLATRLRALTPRVTPAGLHATFARLRDCLVQGNMLLP